MTQNQVGSRAILLRVPTKLNEILVAESDRKGVSMQTLILKAVAKSYGVKIEPPVVGRRLS
jgi:predicted HicB family RNase H-like nuclease